MFEVDPEGSKSPSIDSVRVALAAGLNTQGIKSCRTKCPTEVVLNGTFPPEGKSKSVD